MKKNIQTFFFLSKILIISTNTNIWRLMTALERGETFSLFIGFQQAFDYSVPKHV